MKKLKTFAKSVVSKVKAGDRRAQFIYSGLATVSFGVMLIWFPLGVIAAGVALITLGYFWEVDE